MIVEAYSHLGHTYIFTRSEDTDWEPRLLLVCPIRDMTRWVLNLGGLKEEDLATWPVD